MFFFNKTNASLPYRQSSADSHVADPSATDSWVSPYSNSSTYGDMPSPEQRERGALGKRSSVFTLRSRSNTATPANSSFLSQTSTITSTDSSSRRSSQDIRSLTDSQISPSEISGPKRSLFSRGKRLRRQSSQLSSASVSDDIEEVDTGKRSSVLRKNRYRKGGYGSQGSIPELKHRISSPFGFQHLTHTHRQQFPALDRTTQNELVAEFWAVRASQVPRRELHGIKAEDLHFQNFSSEAVDATKHGERSRSVLARSPPPLSPQRSRDLTLQDSPSPGSSVRGLRHSRSVESFSQPVVKARSHRLSHSVNPPPRVSSRMALTRIDDFHDDEYSANAGSSSARGRFSRASGTLDRSAPPSRPSTAGSISTVTCDPDFIAQAVTTPDDTALPVLSPGFGTELENVPEEPERFFNPRPAPRPPIRSPPLDPSFQRSPRSPTVMRSASRTSSYGTARSFSQRSPKPRPLSQMSDTLGSPTLTQPGRGSIRYSPSAKRQSSYWKNFDSSWEDDIDYCYEHAAEADCDFDWDRGSIECDEESATTQEQHEDDQAIRSPECNDESVETEDDATLQTRFFPGAFRPSLLVPSANNIPELDHRSALSASTDAGALTPSDIFTSAPIDITAATAFIDPEGYSLTPSLLVPQDFKYQAMREEMYEDLLAEYETSDCHYPLMDAAQSIASSSRSSHTRLSKRSSYDSSLISGPGSVSSPVRRSASSSGSIPELVHSRRVRKTFDMMVDQLTEQVASFAHLDEDDEKEAAEAADDETASLPTTNDKGTFFAAEDDDRKRDAETKPDVKGAEHELEFASSTIPVTATHHERAVSDGAAKLLEAAARPAEKLPKTRMRAASSGNAYRTSKQAYTLSLFPTPRKPRKATP